jgi:hypothetical protein
VRRDAPLVSPSMPPSVYVVAPMRWPPGRRRCGAWPMPRSPCTRASTRRRSGVSASLSASPRVGTWRWLTRTAKARPNTLVECSLATPLRVNAGRGGEPPRRRRNGIGLRRASEFLPTLRVLVPRDKETTDSHHRFNRSYRQRRALRLGSGARVFRCIAFINAPAHDVAA